MDSVTSEWDEYPRYLLEALFDRGGDCEDTSLLALALLDRMGYDVCLLLLVEERHAAIGIAIENAGGSYYEHDGKKYFYLETVSDKYQIGEIPPQFKKINSMIFLLK